MTLGLSDSDYKLLENLVLTPLKKKGVRIYLFGSRFQGTNHTFSDVDLLLVPESKTIFSSGDLAQIKEDIEESRFPVKVDFVLIENLASSYRENVLQNKREL